MNNQDIVKKGPVVIAGVGGSGTRLVAEICQRAGIHLGQDLNQSLDNLTYTLLFRRYEWFKNNWHNAGKIDPGLGLLKKIILNSSSFTIREMLFLFQAVLDTRYHYRKQEKAWAWDRLRSIYSPSLTKILGAGWGWKEPNSYLLLPHLATYFPSIKFIFTIRHGLDMVYSKNQNQMKNWSDLLLNDQINTNISPLDQSLKFWIAANRFAYDQGKKLGPEKFQVVKFEDLCRNPDQSVPDLLHFLELEVSAPVYTSLVSLPKPPQTLGRYKNHDLSRFSKDDINAVKEFGYELIDQRK